MHIARHKTDQRVMKMARDSYRSALDDTLARFKRDRSALCHASDELIALFNYSAAIGDEPEPDLGALDLFIEASIASYKIALNPGQEVTFTFRKRPYRAVAKRKVSVTTQGWINAFQAAIARRDRDAISQLAALNLDEVQQLEKRNPLKPLGVDHYYARLLKGLFKKGSACRPYLAKMTEACERVPEASPIHRFTRDLARPEVNLLTSLMNKDEAGFNSALEEALKSHRRYFTRVALRDPYGTVSLPLSALVVMAQDAGMTIEHTSDYVPSCFVGAVALARVVS